MKRAVRLFMILCLLSVPVSISLAQAGEACSSGGIAGRVEEIYAAYSEGVSPDADMEVALVGMDSMLDQINAIYAECDEARYEDFTESGAALLEELREGGYVVYVRHAATDTSQQDTDLASCETQRNLSEQGRIDAANIGAAWTALAVPVGEVISTEYCRTRETAQLAFGEPTIIPKAELESSLETMLAISTAEGMNTVIVGHVDMLETATGISIPEDIRLNEGDALVYHPLGGPMGDQGYELVTRISLRNWADLARIAEAME